jgi:type II pantothenate kinase
VPNAAVAAQRFADSWLAALEALETEAEDEADDPLCCLKLCATRDRLLREAGFPDCFLAVKAAENTSALEHLPGLLAELDALDGSERLLACVQGVFAGNIFDLGAATTAKMFRAGALDFRSTRAKLQSRPWVIDGFDALAERWAGPAHRKAVLFCDNSGADFVLGMLPLARALIQHGSAVILAANSVASINDVTAAELDAFLPRAAAVDSLIASALADGRLRVIASGSDLPVIDLRYLSPELVAESRDADLVVLEGMGRGIESNLRADFACDVLCLGMIKHAEVAEAMGGPLFGCVCRFSPAPESKQEYRTT